MAAPYVDRIVREFDLGTPDRIESLAGGSAEIVGLVTEKGAFVVKPVRRAFEIVLYREVERRLNARGVRQARLFETERGELVSASGHCVQEWLPGAIADRPTPAQSRSLTQYLADYDRALAEVPIPPELDASDTVWTRVVSPRFLLDRLPGLLDAYAPRDTHDGPVGEALAVLADALPAIERLPTQLVHGDLGPDNTLWVGDEVVAVVDFTPYRQPVLFEFCTALYWNHVHGRDEPDRDRIGYDVASYAERGPWTDAEAALVEPMLVREALRRLATPLHVHEELGIPLRTDEYHRRHRAVVGLVAGQP